MQLVSYNRNGRAQAGILQDGSIWDLMDSCHFLGLDFPPPEDLMSLLALGPRALAQLQKAAAESVLPPEKAIPLAEVELGPPLERPGKIVGVARNYYDWLAQANVPVPAEPTLFAKNANTVTGPGKAIVLDEPSSMVSYEAEVAVVMGSRGRNIAVEDALSLVAGYTIVNDVSSVGLIKKDGNLFRGKNMDTFLPMGPSLVTTDEIPDPGRLAIRLTRNGRILQDSNTSQLVMKIPELISYISRGITLEPGDMIATGTPAGTASLNNPPTYLCPGDELEITIEGLGVLSNPVIRV